jgi:hypothetical protein
MGVSNLGLGRRELNQIRILSLKLIGMDLPKNYGGFLIYTRQTQKNAQLFRPCIPGEFDA